MGRHYLGEIDEQLIRMAGGFAGGIGGSYMNNCGAFSAGIMIIGALYGRTSPEGDDQTGQDLAALFQERFQERFETLNCGMLREERYGSGGAEPCSILVERAAQVLLEVVDQQQARDGGGSADRV